MEVLKQMNRFLAAFPILIALAIPAPVFAQMAAVACQDTPGFHQLDFWLGEWDVVDADSGTKVGKTRIESLPKGCAVFENWTSGNGSQGKSLFFFTPVTGIWKQVWVTEAATHPGGVKEQQLIEQVDGGGVRFRGEIATQDGGSYLDQTTLTPLDDGRVRQVIEISTDGGGAWQTTFDTYYVPKDAARSAPMETPQAVDEKP